MAFEAGGEVVEAFTGDVEGVFVHGGATVLAFFDDAIVGAEFEGEDAGPADVKGVADGEGGGDAGGVEAPGVGVAEAKDGFHEEGLRNLTGSYRESFWASGILRPDFPFDPGGAWG